MIPRRLPVLLTLALATIAFTTIATGATRSLDVGKGTPSGATVSGVVTAVNGNLIQLAGGSLTIDATGAAIVTDRGKNGTIADIETGMTVFAVLTTADVHANAPLPAATIMGTRIPEATLFGPVQSVDTTAKTITLLGRTIHITSETSFGGILKKRDGDTPPSLSDILPNELVQVQVESSGGQLVATSVLLIAPVPPEVQATHGTVKSIGTDSWVIGRERGEDLTVVIDAQTKIVGSPKVGDAVDVLYRVDSSHAFVAISIVKSVKLPAPPVTDLFHFTGKVKSIAAQSWVITRESGEEKVVINESSKIEPGIAVGDGVDVLAQRKEDGSVVALAIVKRR